MQDFRDIPIKSVEEDKFGIAAYVSAMSEFIASADSPLSISIQGEWGSGKSSFMHLIEKDLTLNHPDQYRFIWLSTWEFFLEREYEIATGRMIQYIIQQIYKNLKMKGDGGAGKNLVDKVTPYMRMAARGFFSLKSQQDVADTMKLTDDLLGGISMIKSLSELRDDLKGDLEYDGHDYIIMLDDFDRLEPRMAIVLLEAIKNMLDIKGLTFVMAVDFDLVSMGIKEKYGNSFVNNRDIASVFFDKIFQISYPVPMQRYNISEWMRDSFEQMGFFTDRYNEVKDRLEEIMILCTDRNPRSMKGIMSLLQLIVKIISHRMARKGTVTKQILHNSIQVQEMCFLLAGILKKYPTLFQLLNYSRELNDWEARFFLGNNYEECTADEMLMYHLDKKWKRTIFRMYKSNEKMDQEYWKITRLLTIYEEFQNSDDDLLMQVFEVVSVVNSYHLPEDIDNILVYSGDSYEKHSHTQRTQGMNLISYLAECRPGLKFKTAIDVGCGNGKTTIELSKRYPGMNLDAFDISSDQIQMALGNAVEYGNICWAVADLMNKKDEEKYDLVFSNSSMHWMTQISGEDYDPNKIDENAESAYRILYRMLKPGGVLAVHQGGSETYSRLHMLSRQAIIDCGYGERYKGWKFPAYYPDESEFKNMLSRIGFKDIKIMDRTEVIKNPGTLIEDFAVASLPKYKMYLDEQEYRRVGERYFELNSTGEDEIYVHRLYVVATKPIHNIEYDGEGYNASSGTQLDQGIKFLQEVDFSECKDILDAGCGNGRLTRMIKDMHPDINLTGVDISDSQIDVANRLYADIEGLDFAVMDLTDFDESCKYDMVFSNAALHWMRDPMKVYSSLKASLKPGGQLCVCQGGEECYRGLHLAVSEAIDELGLHECYPTDWNFPAFYPSRDDMQKLLEEAGYEKIMVRSVQSSGGEVGTLPEDFAEASLIFYKTDRMTDEQFKELKKVYLRICHEKMSTDSFDNYTHRLYIKARRK